jgi:cytochrome b subunit of formate dehydrogenase
MIIPIFIDPKDAPRIEWPEYSKLTRLEKVWLWLVLFFMALIIITGILTFFGVSWKYFTMTFVGGTVMNIIMIIACSLQKI